MLLEEPVADAGLGPIGCQTSGLRLVKYSWLSLSFQMNGVPGLSDSRNGSIRSVAAKAYDTWLIRPNQERMSVMLLGVGKWRIASRYFLHGLTLSLVISNPANSTVLAPNTNFSGLRVMLFRPQRSSQLTA